VIADTAPGTHPVEQAFAAATATGRRTATEPTTAADRRAEDRGGSEVGVGCLVQLAVVDGGLLAILAATQRTAQHTQAY